MSAYDFEREFRDIDREYPMKKVLLRIFHGILISILGSLTTVYGVMLFCIFLQLHSIESAWGAIICFLCASLLFIVLLIFLYFISYIPRSKLNECPSEYIDFIKDP